MREWKEKEGKVRDERGRKARMDMEDINEQLKRLRKSAENLEDKEKRRRYEGYEGKQPVKPVAGLVLKKDKKDKGVEEKFKSEARAFFGGSYSAFEGRAEPPIASGSIFPAGVGEKFRNDVWQMEFGYRP